MSVDVYVHPGGLITTTASLRFTTILGSCVALCLWSAAPRIAGLSHFVLPTRPRGSAPHDRYADHAIPRLVSELVQQGARKHLLVAKIFGGASLLGAPQAIGDGSGLGQKNIDAARAGLAALDLRIAAEDVGGHHGRKLLFDPESGDVWVKIIARS